MMVTQDGYILLLLLFSVLTFLVGYARGRSVAEEIKYEDRCKKRQDKLKLIEGIDGVTSVQLNPIRYVELLTKEEECNELKLAIKRFADEAH